MIYPIIVTLDQMRGHLLLSPPVDDAPMPETEAFDADLQMKIDAATEAVCDYIADRRPADLTWIATIESWNVPGSPLVKPPAVIVAAVMVQCGEYFRFRGDEAVADPMGVVCPQAANILRRYHDPVLA